MKELVSSELIDKEELVLHELDPQDDVSKKSFELLDYIESYYYMNGHIPTVEKAAQLGIDRELFSKWITSRPFRQKLIDRGVRLPEANVNGWHNSLTPLQKAAADMMTDLMDKRSMRKKLEHLGIDTATWQAWQHDPAFVQYLNSKTESELRAFQWEAHTSLMDAVRSGDLSAVKYYNAMTGRFSENGAQGSNVNLGEVIQVVLEALQEETKHLLEHDPELLKRVGNRLVGFIARIQATSS